MTTAQAAESQNPISRAPGAGEHRGNCHRLPSPAHSEHLDGRYLRNGPNPVWSRPGHHTLFPARRHEKICTESRCATRRPAEATSQSLGPHARGVPGEPFRPGLTRAGIIGSQPAM